jgi:hypothetical protein
MSNFYHQARSVGDLTRPATPSLLPYSLPQTVPLPVLNRPTQHIQLFTFDSLNLSLNQTELALSKSTGTSLGIDHQ